MPIVTLPMNRETQRGFSLIEVMVAMVIFAVGLLGLAGMQLAGTNSTAIADMRTSAIVLADDMADRIRTNYQGVASGAYNNITTAAISTPDNCTLKTCDEPTMAAVDAYEWNQELSDALPSGRGTVKVNGAGPNMLITVMWDEARTGATGENCGPDLTLDLKCYTLEIRP